MPRLAQHILTDKAQILKLHADWRSASQNRGKDAGIEEKEGRGRLVAGKGVEPDSGGALETVSVEEKEDGGDDASGDDDDCGSGGRYTSQQREEDEEGTGEGGGSRALKEWRMPPTCYVCHLPLASTCECTAGSLDVEK